MKILHIIPTLSGQAGGPTEVAINLVKELNQLGAEAEIISTDDDRTGRLNVTNHGAITEFRGVPVRFFSRINPRLKEFIISPAAVSWLRSNIHHYDVLDIHYLFSFVPLVARSLARRQSVPYTVRTMGQLTPWALQQSKWKKKIFFALQEKKNLEMANALHSTSVAEEKDIRAFGLQNKVINLPLGVHQSPMIESAAAALRQKYRIPEGRFVLLFLSRLHYKKRPDLAIEIVGQLEKRFDVHLIIGGAGEADYETLLKQQVAAMQLNDRVTFTGFVSGYDKDLLLQGADLFLLPSFSENFGIAVAEALATGTPVVITPDVQIAEYVVAHDAGILAEGTVNAFMDAIASLILNPTRLDKLRDNGIRLTREVFNWRAIAKQLLVAYDNVLNTPNSEKGSHSKRF